MIAKPVTVEANRTDPRGDRSLEKAARDMFTRYRCARIGLPS